MKNLERGNIEKWDSYWLKICNAVAENSSCLSRKIGAVIVRDKSIISTGYNGPPRGIMTCDKRWLKGDLKEKLAELDTKQSAQDIYEMCPRYVLGYKSGEGLDICIAGHAERNALIEAAREGKKVKGTKHEPTYMYMSCGIPCAPCMIEIINAGITGIICTEISFYDKASRFLLKESHLKVATFGSKIWEDKDLI